MTSKISGTKVYIEIVRKIRLMIEQDGLKPGDKIPSERELSERLLAGRSSVREALRALELLGLIETRRGEGTYIRDARSNQLVQLLSTFVLQDEKAKLDVEESQYLIEMDCLRLIMRRNTEKQLLNIRKWVQLEEFEDEEFFLKMIELADNQLFFRIWIILSDYYHSLNLHEEKMEKDIYMDLVEVLILRDEKAVEEVYSKLRKLSNE